MYASVITTNACPSCFCAWRTSPADSALSVPAFARRSRNWHALIAAARSSASFFVAVAAAAFRAFANRFRIAAPVSR